MSAYRVPGEKEPEPKRRGFTRLQWASLIILGVAATMKFVTAWSQYVAGEPFLGVFIHALPGAVTVFSIVLFAYVFRILNRYRPS